MWKKTDSGTNTSGAALDNAANATERVNTNRRQRSTASDAAVIGSSIVIKGDISGAEDILIHGRVEGTIRLESHNVKIGENGNIAADVTAREIDVEGNVEGDLIGHEKIVVRASGQVAGNIKAPKVVLEEGSQFRGSVEMDVDANNGSSAFGSSAFSDSNSITGNVSNIVDSDKQARG